MNHDAECANKPDVQTHGSRFCRYFTEDERAALFAALLSASKEIHVAQDLLTDEQWTCLDNLLEEVTAGSLK
jgi:hypothetical protein